MAEITHHHSKNLHQFSSAQALFQSIADKYHALMGTFYGQVRSEWTYVPFAGKFVSYHERAEHFILKSPLPAVQQCEEWMPDQQRLGRLLYIMKFSPQGEGIEMSRLYRQLNTQDGSPCIFVSFAPPSSEKTQKIFQAIQTLFSVLLPPGKPATPNASPLQNIAKIHWLLVQLMPLQGGTAAITDVFCKVLMNACGLPSAAWKTGIAPDLEAFLTPLDEYIQIYPNLMEL